MEEVKMEMEENVNRSGKDERMGRGDCVKEYFRGRTGSQSVLILPGRWAVFYRSWKLLDQLRCRNRSRWGGCNDLLAKPRIRYRLVQWWFLVERLQLMVVPLLIPVASSGIQKHWEASSSYQWCRTASRILPCNTANINHKKKSNSRPSEKTMNSEVDKWDADFIIKLFIVGFLKSLPTSVEVDN